MNSEEARSSRIINLFTRLDLAHFGALFRVKESIWKEMFGSIYDKKSIRQDHPGCSLRKNGATLGTVFMLHGTSSKSWTIKDEVAVKDVYGSCHTTWFGGLDPVPMNFELWLNKSITLANKPRLNEIESVAMQNLCKRRGW